MQGEGEIALGPDAAGGHDSNAAVEVADEARPSCRVRHESPCDILAHAVQPVQNPPTFSLNSKFLNLHGDLQTKLHFCKSSDLPPQRREVLPVKRSGVLWKHASVSPSGSLALQTDGDAVLVSETANALTISRKVSAYGGRSNHRHLHSGGRGSEPRHEML